MLSVDAIDARAYVVVSDDLLLQLACFEQGFEGRTF